jgi:hypothetical protein
MLSLGTWGGGHGARLLVGITAKPNDSKPHAGLETITPGQVLDAVWLASYAAGTYYAKVANCRLKAGRLRVD